MKKTTLLVCSLVFSSFFSFSQGNSIRTNLTLGLAVGDFNATYEKKITDKLSISTRTNYMKTSKFPFADLLNVDDINETFPNILTKFSTLGITGGGVRPEFRFHFKGDGLSGGYFGLYSTAQFGNVSPISAQYKRDDANGNEKISYLSFTPKASYIGGGISLGKQWILGKGFTLDLTLINIGVGMIKLTVEGSGDGISDSEYSEYMSLIEQTSVSFGPVKIGPKAKRTAEGVEVSINQVGVVTRIFQFGFGFSF
jgi:hypothetical protein